MEYTEIIDLSNMLGDGTAIMNPKVPHISTVLASFGMYGIYATQHYPCAHLACAFCVVLGFAFDNQYQRHNPCSDEFETAAYYFHHANVACEKRVVENQQHALLNTPSITDKIATSITEFFERTSMTATSNIRFGNCELIYPSEYDIKVAQSGNRSGHRYSVNRVTRRGGPTKLDYMRGYTSLDSTSLDGDMISEGGYTRQRHGRVYTSSRGSERRSLTSVTETETISDYSPSDYDSSLYDVLFDPKCGIDNNLLYAISVSGGIFSLTIQQYFYPPGAIMVLLPDGPLKNTFINPRSRTFVAMLLKLIQRVSTMSSITATGILFARTAQGPYKSRRTMCIEETGEAPPALCSQSSRNRYNRLEPIKHFREKFDWRALPANERVGQIAEIVNQKLKKNIVEPFRRNVVLPMQNAIEKTFPEKRHPEKLNNKNASKTIRGKPYSSLPPQKRKDMESAAAQPLQPYFEAICRLAKLISQISKRAFADSSAAMQMTKDFIVKMAQAFMTLLASRLRCQVRQIQWVFVSVLHRFRECFQH